MTLPITSLSNVPIQGIVLDNNGHFTIPWVAFFQFLYNRVGGNSASSNLQLAAAITAIQLSYVKGPASSTDSDVAIFDGTTGKIIKESGIPISSLAPLVSPAFSGIPTAPTAALNTSSIQLATTAFVQAALRTTPIALIDAATILVDALTSSSFYVTLGGNRSLASPAHLLDGMFLNFAIHQDATGGRTLAFDPIYNFGATGTPTLSTTPNAVDYVFGYYDALSGKILCLYRKQDSLAATFSVHNNGTAQSIPTGTFTKLTFSTEVFDVGNAFTGSTWTPTAGHPVVIEGAYCSNFSAAGALMTVAVYKNGAEYKRGTMIAAQGTGATISTVSCIDIPNGTDTYDLWAFQNTGSAQNTIGSSNLTYFQGTTLAPDVAGGGSGGGGGGAAVWGGITGTLSAQTDLQSALNAITAKTKYIKAATWTGGGSAVVAAGSDVVSHDINVPGTITGVMILTKGGTGSCQIDIWKGTYTGYPPVIGGSITAAALPTVSAGIKSYDTTLTGWTKTLSAGDVLSFVLNSSSTFTMVQIFLEVTP